MHEDLLAQAYVLATADRRRPKQVNLRRAVSAAYYAYFHFLVDRCCRMMLGAQADSRAYRGALGRAFDHGCMRRACSSFEGGTLPTSVLKGLPSRFVIDADLQQLAATFVEAQEKRHLADYDRTERFAREDVLGVLDQVRLAIDRYGEVSDSHARRFFLACLLAWNTLSRR